MELRAEEGDALEEYARDYHSLLGDGRTRRTFNAILKRIIGSESLCCSQIATFSPGLRALSFGEARLGRLVNGDSTNNQGAQDMEAHCLKKPLDPSKTVGPKHHFLLHRACQYHVPHRESPCDNDTTKLWVGVVADAGSD